MYDNELHVEVQKRLTQCPGDVHVVLQEGPVGPDGRSRGALGGDGGAPVEEVVEVGVSRQTL